MFYLAWIFSMINIFLSFPSLQFTRTKEGRPNRNRDRQYLFWRIAEQPKSNLLIETGNTCFLNERVILFENCKCERKPKITINIVSKHNQFMLLYTSMIKLLVHSQGRRMILSKQIKDVILLNKSHIIILLYFIVFT